MAGSQVALRSWRSQVCPRGHRCVPKAAVEAQPQFPGDEQWLQPGVPLPAGHKGCWHQPGGAALPSCSLELPLTQDSSTPAPSQGFHSVYAKCCGQSISRISARNAQSRFCVCVYASVHTKMCALIDRKDSLHLPF